MKKRDKPETGPWRVAGHLHAAMQLQSFSSGQNVVDEMCCVADRINQVETFNDSPGPLVLGESSGAYIERLEQKGRGKQELESKTWRRLIVGEGN